MFTANASSPLSAYRNTGVESITSSAAPHQLVLLLFNGARAAVAAARGHMLRKEIVAKGTAISQAMSIIDGGLKASLDLKVGGEMAQNLSDLYVYMGQRLFHANLKNDVEALDEVAKLLEQLGGAWEMIGAKKPAAQPTAVPKSAASMTYGSGSGAPGSAAPQAARTNSAAPTSAAPPASAAKVASTAKAASPVPAPAQQTDTPAPNPALRNRVSAAYGAF